MEAIAIAIQCSILRSRSGGYSKRERRFRNKCPRAFLAGGGGNTIDRVAGRYCHACRSRVRDELDVERLVDRQRFGTSTATVTGNIIDGSLHLHRHNIHIRVDLHRISRDSKLGQENGYILRADGITQPLRDVDSVLIRRSGRASRKFGGNFSRLNFVATHISRVLVIATYCPIVSAPVAVGSDVVSGAVFKTYSSCFFIGRL